MDWYCNVYRHKWIGSARWCKTARHKCLIDTISYSIWIVGCICSFTTCVLQVLWIQLRFVNTQVHNIFFSNTQCDKIHEYTGIFWHKLVHTAVVSGYADCSAIFSGHAGTAVHIIRRMFVCCSFTRWCCFWIHRYTLDTLQFHTLVLQVLWIHRCRWKHCSFTRWCCRFSEMCGMMNP